MTFFYTFSDGAVNVIIFIRKGVLIRMGVLIGIGALLNKNAFEGGHLLERGAYWKEGTKLNHYES